MNSVVKVALAIGIVGLAACDQRNDPVNNAVAADEINAATTDANLMTGNDAGEMMAEQPSPPEPNVMAPAKVAPTEPAKTAPKASAPAKPAPAKPAPAEPKAAEPKATDPNCLPEHHAAGHC